MEFIYNVNMENISRLNIKKSVENKLFYVFILNSLSIDMSVLDVPKLIETPVNNNSNVNNNLNMNGLIASMPSIDMSNLYNNNTNINKRIIKKRYCKYKHQKNRNISIGISKRMRNHINSQSFDYTNMPKEWYNNECIIGIETCRLLNSNQQRLNCIYNIVNELLTDTIINNNIIEYPCEYNNINNNENDWNWIEYWMDNNNVCTFIEYLIIDDQINDILFAFNNDSFHCIINHIIDGNYSKCFSFSNVIIDINNTYLIKKGIDLIPGINYCFYIDDKNWEILQKH